MGGLDLFISYTREDEPLRLKHLALLKRKGEIRPWQDRALAADDEWRRQFDDWLENAGLILTLVSSDADYCYVGATRERSPGYRPALRLVDLTFAELQILTTDGKPVTTWRNRDLAWLRRLRGLRAANSGLRLSVP